MLKYRGGKSKEIPRIMSHIPRFQGRYIEPFVGGGALFFYIEPRKAIINDINTKLINFYLGVRDNYPSLRTELNCIEETYSQNRRDFELLKSQTPNERVIDKNEDLYYHLRAQFNRTETPNYSDAALYFFINKAAYSGMIRYNSRGEFNVPYGRYAHLNTNIVTLEHCELLKRTDVFCSDYSAIFNMATENDFMFIDPPYDCTFSDYGNEKYKDGFNEEEHLRLAEAFYKLPCKALMIIGLTPLIENLYCNDIVDIYEKTYAVNIRNRFKAEARHAVVMNYRKDINTETSDKTFYYSQAETAQLRLFEPTPNKYGTDK